MTNPHTTTVTPAEVDRMRLLWESFPDYPASRIAARCGVTKNTVIGYANRRRWPPRRPYEPPPNLFDRLAAEHSRLDAVLEASQCPPST